MMLYHVTVMQVLPGKQVKQTVQETVMVLPMYQQTHIIQQILHNANVIADIIGQY